MNSKPYLIKPDSALFIDRDGVINELRPADYVKSASEFILLPEVVPALLIFKRLFKRIFIVTNQQGIGKGLMNESIDKIHEHFLSLVPIELHPDKIYHCPHLKEERCSCRKPMPGMALRAKLDFPEIQLSHSLMVGDSQSDMVFGENCGMQLALISNAPASFSNSFPTYSNLLTFAQHLLQ